MNDGYARFSSWWALIVMWLIGGRINFQEDNVNALRSRAHSRPNRDC